VVSHECIVQFAALARVIVRRDTTAVRHDVTRPLIRASYIQDVLPARSIGEVSVLCVPRTRPVSVAGIRTDSSRVAC